MDDNIGYACGYDGLVFKTLDRGVSWLAQSTGTDRVFRCVGLFRGDAGAQWVGLEDYRGPVTPSPSTSPRRSAPAPVAQRPGSSSVSSRGCPARTAKDVAAACERESGERRNLAGTSWRAWHSAVGLTQQGDLEMLERIVRSEDTGWLSASDALIAAQNERWIRAAEVLRGFSNSRSSLRAFAELRW